VAALSMNVSVAVPAPATVGEDVTLTPPHY
jgi:hypothetical protein